MHAQKEADLAPCPPAPGRTPSTQGVSAPMCVSAKLTPRDCLYKPDFSQTQSPHYVPENVLVGSRDTTQG